MEYALNPVGDADLVSANILYKGKMSIFGGPNDTGVSPSEGLALIDWNDFADPVWQPFFGQKRIGLARSLNPSAWYCAMRWDYTKNTREELRRGVVEVSNSAGKMCFVTPVDWGPNYRTGRLIDLSPGVGFQLGLKTDDVVTAKLVIAKKAFRLTA